MTLDSHSSRIPEWQAALLRRHGLGSAYLSTALEWFGPLARSLAKHQKGADRPILVAINGCQGSGKTTVADYLCCALAEDHGVAAIALSLDDFYLTRAEREELAVQVHPLLRTRGVPGTHDLGLLRETLVQLLNGEQLAIPRFDKAIDDRKPAGAWDKLTSPVQVVLLEGWCIGVHPEPADALATPVNDLERFEDPDGNWRSYCNQAVANEFLPLYDLVDEWIMLRAPAFECVFEWRQEQEQKLAATLSPEKAAALMDEETLTRFIAHYERYTRQCLALLPDKVNHLYSLDHQRHVRAYSHRWQAGVAP